MSEENTTGEYRAPLGSIEKFSKFILKTLNSRKDEEWRAGLCVLGNDSHAAVGLNI